MVRAEGIWTAVAVACVVALRAAGVSASKINEDFICSRDLINGRPCQNGGHCNYSPPFPPGVIPRCLCTDGW